MARESNFTDRQKADLFVRDRATCAYTGRSLWLLDYGADPYYQVDWADHRVPVAKGGRSTLANGVSAAWHVNFRKRDTVGQHLCVFRAGKPTPQYFKAHKELAPKMRRQLERFSRLHHSDWFLNRALFLLWLGIAYLSEEGCTRTRDDHYYARAALRKRSTWLRASSNEKVPCLEARGLTPRRPRDDQVIMLKIREEASDEGVLGLMRRLLPIYSAKV